MNDNNQQTDGRNGQEQPQPAAGAVSAGHGAPGNADGAVHASGVPATEELSTAASQPTAAADAAASRTAPATAPGPAVPPGAPMTGAPMTGTGKQPRKWATRIVAATGTAGIPIAGRATVTMTSATAECRSLRRAGCRGTATAGCPRRRRTGPETILTAIRARTAQTRTTTDRTRTVRIRMATRTRTTIPVRAETARARATAGRETTSQIPTPPIRRRTDPIAARWAARPRFDERRLRDGAHRGGPKDRIAPHTPDARRQADGPRPTARQTETRP